MSTLLLGMLGGFFAWLLTFFIAQPLYALASLRAQVAEALARYESDLEPNNIVPRHRAPEWLLERKNAYEALGARLIGFADANAIIARMLYKVPLRGLRLYVRNAGSSLQTLADTERGVYATVFLRSQIASNLKFGGGVSTVRRS